MIRRATVVLLLLTASAAPVAAAGVRLDGTRFVGNTAGWTEIFAWADQAQRVDKLAKRHRRPGKLPRALVEARQKLEKLAVPLGKAWPLTWNVRADRVRLETASSIFLAQPFEGGFKAQLTPADRSALLMALPFAKQMALSTRPQQKLRLEKTDAKPRKIFGFTSREYRITGCGSGEMWITTPKKGLLEPLTGYFTAARKHLDGYPGDLLYHAVLQAGGVPVLARFEGVKGMTVSGNSLGAATVLCHRALLASDAKDEAFEIPTAYAITRLPPR